MTSTEPTGLRSVVAGKDPMCLGGTVLAVLGAALLPALISGKGHVTGEGIRVAGLMLLLATVCWIEAGTGLILDLVTLPGALAGVLGHLLTNGNAASSLLGALVGYGIPALGAAIYHRRTGKDGIGAGAFKLTAMVGAFLGWPGALLTLAFALAFGFAVAMILARITRRVIVETGPLLTAGAIASTLTLYAM